MQPSPKSIAGGAFALGVVVGVLGLAIYASATGGALTEPSRVEVLEGFTNGVNAKGSAIGFAPSVDAKEGEGYILSGARWSFSDENTWHEALNANGEESCVPPNSSGQKLQLGIVDVPSGENAPGGPRVVWFRCLGEPSETTHP